MKLCVSLFLASTSAAILRPGKYTRVIPAEPIAAAKSYAAPTIAAAKSYAAPTTAAAYTAPTTAAASYAPTTPGYAPPAAASYGQPEEASQASSHDSLFDGSDVAANLLGGKTGAVLGNVVDTYAMEHLNTKYKDVTELAGTAVGFGTGVGVDALMPTTSVANTAAQGAGAAVAGAVTTIALGSIVGAECTKDELAACGNPCYHWSCARNDDGETDCTKEDANDAATCPTDGEACAKLGADTELTCQRACKTAEITACTDAGADAALRDAINVCHAPWSCVVKGGTNQGCVQGAQLTPEAGECAPLTDTSVCEAAVVAGVDVWKCSH